MTMAPSFVHFWPAIFSKRALTNGGSDGDRDASNRNSTALLILLIFTPFVHF